MRADCFAVAIKGESADLDEAIEISKELGRANPGGAYEIRPLLMFAPGGKVA